MITKLTRCKKCGVEHNISDMVPGYKLELLFPALSAGPDWDAQGAVYGGLPKYHLCWECADPTGKYRLEHSITV